MKNRQAINPLFFKPVNQKIKKRLWRADITQLKMRILKTH